MKKTLLLMLCMVLQARGDLPPNFIVIMGDDLGYGDTSAYGGWIPTPALERMSREGMRFTDYHSSGNVCSPTRAGLLTGRYQQRAGVPGVINADPQVPAHQHFLNPETTYTFAEALKAAGYHTAMFGKWHLGYETKANPIHHGFDEFRGYISGNVDYFTHHDRMGTEDWWKNDHLEPEEGYSTHLITAHGLRFIREQAGKGPFCLYLAHEAVHAPFQGPGDDPGPKPSVLYNTRNPRPRKDVYREMMTEMDRGVGQVLDAVQAAGIADHTLVIYISDNGAAKGAGSNEPLRGSKGNDYEGGHRVPGIFWWPGQISPGKTSTQTAICLDVMPTLLDFAGITQAPPRALDGISLKPWLVDGATPKPRQLFWNGVAMRDGDWKLMKTKDSTSLYHLGRDLAEANDLAKENPERVATMSAALKTWIQDVQPE